MADGAGSRSIPHHGSVALLPELVAVRRGVVGERRAGLVFLREKLAGKTPTLAGTRADLGRVLEERVAGRRAGGQVLRRADVQRVAHKVWWDAGAVRAGVVRSTFLRIMGG